MMFLAILSPLLALPLVLALHRLEAWALGSATSDRRVVRNDTLGR